jgi:hypothetical protein
MKKILKPALATGAAAAMLAVGGCDATDPLLRAGLWRPSHANRVNLTVTAAYPADLVRGTGSNTSDGVLAAAAVDRLHINKVKKLPNAGLSEIEVKSQGGSEE